MSVISRVKCFFVQTICAYGEIMRESDADWHLVAKRMMYDFRVFNAEICDISSDLEDSPKEIIEPPFKKSNVSSPVHQWRKAM